MIRGDKFVQLLEQQRTAATSQPRASRGYRSEIRRALGLKRNQRGEPTLDLREREIDHREVSLQEVAHAFLGRHYRDPTRLREAFNLTWTLRESSGVVVPSHFSNINAFTDTVSGLLDAAILEGYQNPALMGKTLVRVKENVRVSGGKEVRVANDGAPVDTHTPHAEPYKLVGLGEDWIRVPENERRGQALAITEGVFIYDRTDQVMEAGSNHGFAIQRSIEQSIADQVMGLTNNYERQDAASNTYLSVAGAAPNDYTNSSTNELVDITDIHNAQIVLAGNTDPATGYEITIPPENLQLIVMPQNALVAREISRAQTVEQRTNTGTEIRTGPSPLPPFQLIEASFVWYNRLIAAGVTAANAQARWYMGLFNRAFAWRSVIPFQSFDVPASGEEARQDVVAVKVAREWGVCYTVEPRYSYRGTKE